jgi:hypothetical protein
MSELAVGPQNEGGRDGTLYAIVQGGLGLIPGARWAGICLVHGSRVTGEASSDDLVFELDQLQRDFGEGPCLSAIRQQHAVRVADLVKPVQPWPRFAASDLGAGRD